LIVTCWKAVSHGFAALQAINVLTDLTLILTRLVTVLPRTRTLTLRVTVLFTGFPITTSSVTVPRDTIGPLATPAGGVADATTETAAPTVRQTARPPKTKARRRGKELRNRDMAAPFPCCLPLQNRAAGYCAPTLSNRFRRVNEAAAGACFLTRPNLDRLWRSNTQE
jgi:hypothetical protein